MLAYFEPLGRLTMCRIRCSVLIFRFHFLRVKMAVRRRKVGMFHA